MFASLTMKNKLLGPRRRWEEEKLFSSHLSPPTNFRPDGILKVLVRVGEWVGPPGGAVPPSKDQRVELVLGFLVKCIMGSLKGLALLSVPSRLNAAPTSHGWYCIGGVISVGLWSRPGPTSFVSRPGSQQEVALAVSR